MTTWEQLTIDGRAVKMPAAHATHGRLTIVGTRLTQDQHRRVRREAERRECSVAAILRDAVAEWLDKYARP